VKSVILLGKRRSPGSPREQWPGAELWGTTSSNQKYAKKHGAITDWTSWWDLHPVHPTPFYRGIRAMRPETYAWYTKLPGPDSPKYRPVWMLEKDPLVPASVAFPWREVLDWARVPDEPGAWMTCQVDWMMAYAIREGYQHIILHGHGVSREPAHMVAHRGILHWVTVARERGVRVTIVPPSWYIAPEQPYGVAAGGLGVRR
jgi:hypothetical protein